MMAGMPKDPHGAAAFRTATEGMALKEIASYCHVRESLVCKWRQAGNVPEAHIDELPDDVRRRYAELQGKRRGAVVLERDMLVSLLDFFLSLVALRPGQASLASAIPAAALTGRPESVGA
jgi:hypothetical protein